MEEQKKLYTTHEVAKLLGVTPITVIRWIEGGKFKCFTTVGGHRRIEHKELERFAQAYNLPWKGEEEIQSREDYVILAVDDDDDILELLDDVLSQVEGLRLITVNNGFTAGAKLVEESPDMVLLDFRMPEIDGFEFSRFVRQDPRFKNVVLLAVTGLSSEEDHEKMKEVGVNGVVNKPFTIEALLAKIDQYRNQKEARKAS